MSGFVGADHQFHDVDYAQQWADRFTPTPERQELFEAMVERIRGASLPTTHIVELGVGPGYLARALLDAIPDVTYEGVDFSNAMLEIAAQRLHDHARRVRFTQADFLSSDWTDRLHKPIGAIVSTWALHDLGGPDRTAAVYQALRQVLTTGAILLNGDFVKPDQTSFDYEAGRFTVARHLELLTEAGFTTPRCVAYFEHEIEQPTAAQNYALIEGLVGA